MPCNFCGEKAFAWMLTLSYNYTTAKLQIFRWENTALLASTATHKKGSLHLPACYKIWLCGLHRSHAQSTQSLDGPTDILDKPGLPRPTFGWLETPLFQALNPRRSQNTVCSKDPYAKTDINSKCFVCFNVKLPGQETMVIHAAIIKLYTFKLFTS